ncbi:uncharacterized protein LOC129754048 [Uranotaenia lowii]|uniref:uncharacterized protein LOC129754048 n=1 Tax=Uranotaenia lowii TaxID=190385 RepID=UPI00247862AF|nr:uncharacterized protein LOC129754048 [Uranotaenia lowii]
MSQINAPTPSIGRPSTTNAGSHNCQECDRNDSFDNMVQCNFCPSWWHFKCAGVDATVENRTWKCKNCVAKGSSQRPLSQTGSALQRLRERQELERQRADLELRQKHLIEQETFINSEESRSNRSGISPVGIDQRTQQWVDSIDEQAFIPEPTMLFMPPGNQMSSGIPQLRRQLAHCEADNSTTEQLENLQRQLQLCHEFLATLSAGELPKSTGSNKSMAAQEKSNEGLGNRTGAIPKSVATGASIIGHPMTNSKPAGEYVQQQESVMPTGECHASDHTTRYASFRCSTINRTTNYGQQRLESARPSVHSCNPNNQYAQVNQITNQVKRNPPRVSQLDEQAIHLPPHPTIDIMNLIPNQSSQIPLPNTHSETTLPNCTSSRRTRFEPLPNRASQNILTDQSILPQASHIEFQSMPTRSVVNAPQSEFFNAVCPTPQQMAARQSFPRELPSFSGDPTDWPMFIANYEYTTATCGYSNGENMLRLQHCLKGHALQTVRSRLVHPAAVPQVIEALRLRYGRADFLINTLLQKVRAIPVIRSDKLEALVDYGDAVQALCDHIEAANEPAHLVNPQLLQELVEKLPTEQRMLWAAYKRDLQGVDLRTFGDYMTVVAKDALGVISFNNNVNKLDKQKSKPKGYINAHAESNDSSSEQHNEEITEDKQVSKLECRCCGKSGHRLRECYRFKGLLVEERWNIVKALRLCYACLSSHGRRACRSGISCDVVGCNYRHHPLLHNPKESKIQMTHFADHHTHRAEDSPTLFRIVPVTVYGASTSVETYAFLDEGSDLTLVEVSLAQQLGLQGSVEPLCLRWTGNTTRTENDSCRIDISVSGVGQEKLSVLKNARTVKYLNLPTQSFDAEHAAKQFKHLRGIPLKSYRRATPRILIGVDNLRFSVPLKIKEGDGLGPVASKTRLGWCVYGQHPGNPTSSFSFHICGCTADENLNELVKSFLALEQVEETGLKPLSEQEQRALNILKQTTKRVGDRFQTGLLWVSDSVVLPNSYNMSLRRLKCLEKRMSRDDSLRKNLHQQIIEYVDKGYAHKATLEELQEANTDRIWYLPLGAVINPKKPGKVRIIWDAAAKVSGISLNSKLMKGPDQLSSLPGILFQFRLYQIAVSSDVKEMFHQVQIIPEDKHSQRFLWRTDPEQEPDIYLMDVATFGSTCSPASAQYVKNLNAEQHVEQYPEAAKSIVHRYYMDDYFESFSNETKASKISKEIRQIQLKGGFVLHNWRSNCSQVLESLGVWENPSTKQLNLASEDKVERVLGMLWNPTTDKLGFSTQMRDDVQQLISSGKRPTKRQILRCVMTLLDPLGLLAPFVIHGKVLIQDLWRSGIGWDDEVGDTVFTRWTEWINMIEFVSNVQISRCYFPGATESTYENTELHVFVDASEIAYACAAYIRVVAKDGRAVLQLISGKAKAKSLSTPPLQSGDGYLQEKIQQTRLLNGDAVRTLTKTLGGMEEIVGDTKEEMRSTVLVHISYQSVIEYNKFSKWERLYRTTAYVLRFLKHFDGSLVPSGLLQQPELLEAAQTVIKQVQKESYPEEISILRSNKGESPRRVISSRSLIHKLDPFLDECKIRKAKPAEVRMAPLPAARLAEGERPFTYTGLDYFGPLYVTINKSSRSSSRNIQ